MHLADAFIQTDLLTILYIQDIHNFFVSTWHVHLYTYKYTHYTHVYYVNKLLFWMRLIDLTVLIVL